MNNVKTKVIFAFILSVYWQFAIAEGDEKVYLNPELIVDDYYSSLMDSGYTKLNEYLHPKEKMKIRNLLLPVLEEASKKGKKGYVQAIFGSNATIDSVRSLNDDEFAKAYFQSIQQTMLAKGVRFQFSKVKKIGSLNEGEDLAHVLVRVNMNVNSVAVDSLDVISVKKFDNGWKLLLKADLEDMVYKIRQRLSTQ